jgi:hypothetical protein
MSKGTATKIIKNLNELEIIKTIRSKPELVSKCAGGFRPEYTADLPGYFFTYDNNLFQQSGAKHDMLIYPVKLPQITMKIYKAYKSVIQ